MQMFRYLHYGLAGVLAFIGLNMIGDYFAVILPPTRRHPYNPNLDETPGNRRAASRLDRGVDRLAEAGRPGQGLSEFPAARGK